MEPFEIPFPGDYFLSAVSKRANTHANVPFPQLFLPCFPLFQVFQLKLWTQMEKMDPENFFADPTSKGTKGWKKLRGLAVIAFSQQMYFHISIQSKLIAHVISLA